MTTALDRTHKSSRGLPGFPPVRITQLDQENDIYNNTGEEFSRFTVLSSGVEKHPVETDLP